MEAHRVDLDAVEEILHDATLYTDESRKQEMMGLMQKQAELKEALAALEWEWLEASEDLDKAEKEL
jgi:ATP-binding cassette subfamily F protein 3